VHRLHAILEYYGITAYIPLQGSYHPIRDGFTYDINNDVYLRSQGKQLRKDGIRLEKGFGNHYYISKQSECKSCLLKEACSGKKDRITHAVTLYRNHYQHMQERLESGQGKHMKRRRMATVEPVFGSLMNYFGMWANARGKLAAHKMMLMAAIAYNLQKLLICSNHPKSNVQILAIPAGQYPLFCSFLRCATATTVFLQYYGATIPANCVAYY
jgi:hypothetical protein